MFYYIISDYNLIKYKVVFGLLYNGYRVFPGGKVLPGRDADPSPSSSAEVKNRVELYLYSTLLSIRAFVACERVKPTKVVFDYIIYFLYYILGYIQHNGNVSLEKKTM